MSKTYDPTSDRDRVLLASIAYQEEQSEGWYPAHRNFANGHGVKPQFVEVYGHDWRRLKRMRTEGLITKREQMLSVAYRLTDDGRERLSDLTKPIKRSRSARKAR